MTSGLYEHDLYLQSTTPTSCVACLCFAWAGTNSQCSSPLPPSSGCTIFTYELHFWKQRMEDWREQGAPTRIGPAGAHPGLPPALSVARVGPEVKRERELGSPHSVCAPPYVLPRPRPAVDCGQRWCLLCACAPSFLPTTSRAPVPLPSCPFCCPTLSKYGSHS